MSHITSRIRAMAARGTRGGLLAGGHLGADEVHHLCELLETHFAEHDRALIRMRELTESLMDEAHDDDLAELHGLVLTLMGEKHGN